MTIAVPGLHEWIADELSQVSWVFPTLTADEDYESVENIQMTSEGEWYRSVNLSDSVQIAWITRQFTYKDVEYQSGATFTAVKGSFELTIGVTSAVEEYGVKFLSTENGFYTNVGHFVNKALIGFGIKKSVFYLLG